MITEATQLLNDALIAADPAYIPVYKRSHPHHPLVKWTGKSRANFDWLCKFGLELAKEYTYRYGKIHKCQAIIESLQHCKSREKMPDIGMTTFLRCMPDEYKVDDVVESYRNYYRGAKQHIAKWTKRPEPEWWNND
jgi:hypothetical protein